MTSSYVDPIEVYAHLISEGESVYPPIRKRLTKKDRELVYKKYDGRCAYCGCEITIKQMQVDHLWPIRLNGIDAIENWMPSCRRCNNYKTGNPPYSFRKMLEHTPDVLLRDSTTFCHAERFGLVKINRKPIVFYFEICDNKK